MTRIDSASASKMYIACVGTCSMSQETVVKFSLARHIWSLSWETEIARMYTESRFDLPLTVTSEFDRPQGPSHFHHNIQTIGKYWRRSANCTELSIFHSSVFFLVTPGQRPRSVTSKDDTVCEQLEKRSCDESENRPRSRKGINFLSCQIIKLPILANRTVELTKSFFIIIIF